MMFAALALVCSAVAAQADSIVARDLAPAFQNMEGVAPEAVVSLAPEAGVRRFFSMAELRRLAARWKLASQPEREICFERPMQPLDSARLLQAMQRSAPSERVEILEYSSGGAPQGEIEFPLSGLRRNATGAFWYGSVRYERGKRYLIWARVALVSAPNQMVALRGSSESQGPMDVQKGDSVVVGVRSGGALLEIEARAASSGAKGRPVWVVNPSSGRRFRAVVEAPGRALVDADKP